MTTREFDITCFKLAVFDVDGTLLDSAHCLRPFTRQTLLTLQVRGVHLSLATGKMLNNVTGLIGELQLSVPLVLANGAVLQHPDGRVVHETCMRVELVRTILELSVRHDITCVIQRVGGNYTLQENRHIHSLLQYGGSFRYCGQWDAAPGGLEDVVKILTVEADSRERLREFEGVVKRELSSQVDSLATVPQILEYMTPGVNKAFGIRRLADWLGIGMHQVMAFGDDSNDVEMLQAAGLGLAMGNAIASAKASADLVIGSHDEEGPATFLAEMLEDNTSA